MSGIDREAVAAELLDLLDQIDAAEERAREANKSAKDRIAKLRGQAQERRDILAGKKGVQIPLTAAVLAEAGKVAKRKGAKADPPCPKCGVTKWAEFEGRQVCHECGGPYP